MKSIANFLNRLDGIIAAIALVLTVVITVLGVFMRYVLENPITWTEEAMLALMVWFTFMGSSSAFKEDGHVSIDFIVERMGPKLRKGFDIFRYLVLIIILVVVFIWYGYQLAMQAGDKITPILKIPYTFIDISVVLCGIYSLVRILTSLVQELRRG